MTLTKQDVFRIDIAPFDDSPFTLLGLLARETSTTDSDVKNFIAAKLFEVAGIYLNLCFHPFRSMLGSVHYDHYISLVSTADPFVRKYLDGKLYYRMASSDLAVRPTDYEEIVERFDVVVEALNDAKTTAPKDPLSKAWNAHCDRVMTYAKMRQQNVAILAKLSRHSSGLGKEPGWTALTAYKDACKATIRSMSGRLAELSRTTIAGDSTRERSWRQSEFCRFMAQYFQLGFSTIRDRATPTAAQENATLFLGMLSDFAERSAAYVRKELKFLGKSEAFAVRRLYVTAVLEEFEAESSIQKCRLEYIRFRELSGTPNADPVLLEKLRSRILEHEGTAIAHLRSAIKEVAKLEVAVKGLFDRVLSLARASETIAVYVPFIESFRKIVPSSCRLQLAVLKDRVRICDTFLVTLDLFEPWKVDARVIATLSDRVSQPESRGIPIEFEVGTDALSYRCPWYILAGNYKMRGSLLRSGRRLVKATSSLLEWQQKKLRRMASEANEAGAISLQGHLAMGESLFVAKQDFVEGLSLLFDAAQSQDDAEAIASLKRAFDTFNQAWTTLHKTEGLQNLNLRSLPVIIQFLGLYAEGKSLGIRARSEVLSGRLLEGLNHFDQAVAKFTEAEEAIKPIESGLTSVFSPYESIGSTNRFLETYCLAMRENLSGWKAVYQWEAGPGGGGLAGSSSLEKGIDHWGKSAEAFATVGDFVRHLTLGARVREYRYRQLAAQRLLDDMSLAEEIHREARIAAGFYASVNDIEGYHRAAGFASLFESLSSDSPSDRSRLHESSTEDFRKLTDPAYADYAERLWAGHAETDAIPISRLRDTPIRVSLESEGNRSLS